MLSLTSVSVPWPRFLAVIAAAGVLVSGCGRSPIGAAQSSGSRTSSPAPVAQISPSPVATCPAPAARGGSVVAFDADRQNLVLFGGAGREIYGDTWLWSNSCWKQPNVASSPPSRYEAAGAFDPSRHVTVVYGGRTATDNWLDDTWTWDGSAWTQVQQTPQPHIRFPMGAFDAAIGKFVVYGLTTDYSRSQTWVWDGGGWQQVSVSASPPPRFSSAIAYDAVAQKVVMFGGRQTSAFLGDTWAFDGTSWTQLTSPKSPAPRQNHLMASASSGVLLYGGQGQGLNFTDTWMWTSGSWQQLSTALAPGGWGMAGIASRHGQPIVVSYLSLDSPAQTFLFIQGDWVLG